MRSFSPKEDNEMNNVKELWWISVLERLKMVHAVSLLHCGWCACLCMHVHNTYGFLSLSKKKEKLQYLI